MTGTKTFRLSFSKLTNLSIGAEGDARGWAQLSASIQPSNAAF